MDNKNVNNPLHGITLQRMLNSLLGYYGWNELGYRINIHCFNENPSVKSSLKFLRKTPWARKKVEDLYLYTEKLRAKQKPEDEEEKEEILSTNYTN